MRCPKCNSQYGNCPECGKEFEHGDASQCDEPKCMSMNAPIDCKCGLVFSHNKDGVLSFDMDLLPYRF